MAYVCKYAFNATVSSVSIRHVVIRKMHVRADEFGYQADCILATPRCTAYCFVNI